MAFVSTPLNALPRPARSPRFALSPLRPVVSSPKQPRRVVPRAVQAREVSDEELETVLLENARPLVLDAFAPWCGPCQFLKPQLDILADKYGDRLDVLKLNTEDYPNIASQLEVRGLPTLFFIKNGKLRYRMEGAATAEDLEKYVEFILFDGPPPVAPA